VNLPDFALPGTALLSAALSSVSARAFSICGFVRLSPRWAAMDTAGMQHLNPNIRHGYNEGWADDLASPELARFQPTGVFCDGLLDDRTAITNPQSALAEFLTASASNPGALPALAPADSLSRRANPQHLDAEEQESVIVPGAAVHDLGWLRRIAVPERIGSGG